MKKDYKAIILTGIVGVLACTCFYGNILQSPGDFLFSSSGDGLKNYYTVAYHVKWDSSYTQFQGMNYPYGEIVTYTDGQPFLANLLKMVGQWLPNLVSNPVAIMNWLMIFSIVVCMLFLSLIFSELKLPWWYNILISVGIGLMSPQVFRFPGHYALAYSFCIPLTLFLLLKFDRANSKWLVSILLALINFIWLFMHPYLGMISIVLLMGYWIIYYIQFGFKTFFIKSEFGHIFIQCFMSLLLFTIIIKFIDPHSGRPDSPFGLLLYNARAETVFIAHHPPMKNVVEWVWKIKGQSWEGWAYIGLVAVLVCSLSIGKTYRYIRRKNYSKILRPVLPKPLQTFIWAGVLILFFSMAYPFKLYMEFLLELIPPLKQFRSMGRFAWIFFYIINIYAYYFIYLKYRKLRSLGKYMMANLMIIFALLMPFIESYAYHTGLAEGITKENNLFHKNATKQMFDKCLNHINISDYQAILPLPYFHIGSENIEIVGTEKSKRLAQLFSYETGLPLMASMMSRTSIEEATKLRDFVEGKERGEYLKDLPCKKSILIIYSHEEIFESEKYFLKNSKKVYEEEDYSVLALDPLIQTSP